MKFGTFFFPTAYAIDVVDLAKELEDRGFESLFLCEHTHIPVSRETAFPGGGELPEKYAHTYDPFVALSFAAAATRTLTLGTGISLITQRDPIVTAKAAASLDLLSGGRFVLGAGGGWNLEEMRNHGTDPKTRFKVLEERLKAIKALWTEEEAEFHGDFVDFDPVWSYPKPATQPHPPILIGGETDHTIRRVVEFADGWFPRANYSFDPAEGMSRLRKAADAAGRSMSTLSVTVFRAIPEPAHIEACREAGIDRVLFDVPDKGRDEVLTLLDGYGKLMG